MSAKFIRALEVSEEELRHHLNEKRESRKVGGFYIKNTECVINTEAYLSLISALKITEELLRQEREEK